MKILTIRSIGCTSKYEFTILSVGVYFYDYASTKPAPSGYQNLVSYYYPNFSSFYHTEIQSSIRPKLITTYLEGILP